MSASPGIYAGDAASRTDDLGALAARAASVLQRSSRSLSGKRSLAEADRAARWASWQRLVAENPRLVQPLFGAVADAVACAGDREFLDRALAGAISLVGADFGNIQLVDGVHGSLRIASQLGFDEDFLHHFAEVRDDSSVCGRAAHARAQTVISDVRVDPLFAPHRQIAAAAGFRAVQSTPICGRGGRLLGIVSTHFRHPRSPKRQELLLTEWYADCIGAALRARLEALPGQFASRFAGITIAANGSDRFKENAGRCA
jgi:GAF domain-containing protein